MPTDNLGIKQINFFLFFLLLPAAFIFTSCEDEESKSRDYPRLEAVQIVNVNDSGATFMADLYSLGTETIIDHGFVWGKDNNLEVKYDDRIFLGAISAEGIFDADIRTALKTEDQYYVKAFVKTEKRIVYSPVGSFKSLGSLGPTIEYFEPKSAGLRDTIKIFGNNFSWLKDQNTVKIGGIVCYPSESTDTSIKVTVTPGITSIKNLISVDVAGSVALFTKDTFRLIPPTFKDYSPKTAFWGDTITITGSYLNVLGSITSDYVKLDENKCRIITYSKDQIKAKVPDELKLLSNNLSLSVGGFLFSSGEPFILKEPYFSFTPKYGTWGDKIILKGKFNSNKSNNTVYFGDYIATISSATNSELQVLVPLSLSNQESKISLHSDPFVVASSDNFHLYSPIIKSFSPVSGPSGTVVTITGKYFGNTMRYVYPIVKFGDTNAILASFNDSTIIVYVPQMSGGPVHIQVMEGSMSATSTGTFAVGNPLISSFSPLTGTFYEEITINGENFINQSGNTRVFFGSIEADVVSATTNKVITRVPAYVDSIPLNITIYAGSSSGTSQAQFTLEPPSITSFSPGTVTPGSDITITGSNFNPENEYNHLSWCGFPLTIKSASSTQITATWPDMLPRFTEPLKIVTGGYTRTSSSNLSFTNSKWRRITSPVIFPVGEFYGYWNGDHLYGKALNGYGYVVNLIYSTYRFNPSTDQWTLVSTGNQKNDVAHSSGEVTAGDSLYLVSGYGVYSQENITAYNTETNKWRAINGGPYGLDGVAFYLNNRIYFGLSNYTYSPFFYQCDISNNYSWTQLSDFPGSITCRFSTYFSVSNRGYLVFANGTVWEFNPDQLSWTQKNSFPGEARDMSFSFILGGKAYVGGGQNNSGLYNDIWEYNQAGDTWSLYTLMPVKCFGSVAFTINGKLYTGYGRDNSGQRFDFYEFDPDYPVN